jgi:hypothetical protein
MDKYTSIRDYSFLNFLQARAVRIRVLFPLCSCSWQKLFCVWKLAGRLVYMTGIFVQTCWNFPYDTCPNKINFLSFSPFASNFVGESAHNCIDMHKGKEASQWISHKRGLVHEGAVGGRYPGNEVADACKRKTWRAIYWVGHIPEMIKLNSPSYYHPVSNCRWCRLWFNLPILKDDSCNGPDEAENKNQLHGFLWQVGCQNQSCRYKHQCLLHVVSQNIVGFLGRRSRLLI